MRKYLAAATVGALLIAGQAAASDNALLTSVGDRVGSQSGVAQDMHGNDTWIIIGGVVLLIGVIAWGFSQNGSGTPSSP